MITLTPRMKILIVIGIVALLLIVLFVLYPKKDAANASGDKNLFDRTLKVVIPGGTQGTQGTRSLRGESSGDVKIDTDALFERHKELFEKIGMSICGKPWNIFDEDYNFEVDGESGDFFIPLFVFAEKDPAVKKDLLSTLYLISNQNTMSRVREENGYYIYDDTGITSAVAGFTGPVYLDVVFQYDRKLSKDELQNRIMDNMDTLTDETKFKESVKRNAKGYGDRYGYYNESKSYNEAETLQDANNAWNDIKPRLDKIMSESFKDKACQAFAAREKNCVVNRLNQTILGCAMPLEGEPPFATCAIKKKVVKDEIAPDGKCYGKEPELDSRPVSELPEVKCRYTKEEGSCVNGKSTTKLILIPSDTSSGCQAEYIKEEACDQPVNTDM